MPRPHSDKLVVDGSGMPDPYNEYEFMRILQRYIIRELLLPFVLCFITLNFIFMGGYLVKAAHFIIGRGVPLTDTLYVLSLALPDMVSYTVPTSVLTSTLIVFGSLSQNNEIRAMRASGIHPFSIIAPVFLLGIILSFTMFVFNDQVASNAGFELRKTTKKMLIKHPSAIIEPGRFVKLNDSIVFLAKELDGNKMRDIVAYENEEEDRPVRTIIAERGEIVQAGDGSEITIRLYDGTLSDQDDASVQSIQFQTYEFPTLGQEDINKMRKKVKDLSLAELLVRSQQKGNTSEDDREIWSAFNHQISFSFGSFIFVLIGIPVAVLVRRGEIILSFAFSMAAVSVYYILFVGAKTIALQGILPPTVAYWTPNMLLGGIGILLLRKSFRV